MSYCTILCLSNYFRRWIIAQMYVLKKKIINQDAENTFLGRASLMGQKSIRNRWEFGEEGFKMPEIDLLKRNIWFFKLYFGFFLLEANFNWNIPDGAWSVCPLMRGVCNNGLFLRAFLWGIWTRFFRSSIFDILTKGVGYSMFLLLRNFIASIYFHSDTNI